MVHTTVSSESRCCENVEKFWKRKKNRIISRFVCLQVPYLYYEMRREKVAQLLFFLSSWICDRSFVRNRRSQFTFLPRSTQAPALLDYFTVKYEIRVADSRENLTRRKNRQTCDPWAANSQKQASESWNCSFFCNRLLRVLSNRVLILAEMAAAEKTS